MRLCVLLDESGNGGCMVPIHYNHLVQALIYSNLSPKLSSFLHDKGFLYGKRRFKFFTFSRLLSDGKTRRFRDKIRLETPVRLYISSSIDRFTRELANSLLKKGEVFIGGEKLEVKGIHIPETPHLKSPIKIRMLSPVTVYSTLLTSDGRKKTYYYAPFEKEFSKLIDENAKKKYRTLYGKKYKSSLNIKPIRTREVIVLFKKTVIKGWLGIFMLEGPKGLIKITYESGLGSKNSQGFGMFEVT